MPQDLVHGAARPRAIGLVGGLGVGATVQVYRALVEACLAKGVSPELTIAHADVSRVLALAGGGGSSELALYLAEIIKRLAAAGAQVVAIPALTPHICFQDLAKISTVPLINMLSITAEEVKRRGLSRVALFGTRTTIESRLFGTLDDIDVLTPHPDEIALIHAAYATLVRTGQGTPEQEATLRTMAHRLTRQEGVDAIILAGTELSLLFGDHNTDFPVVDCGRLLVAALVAETSATLGDDVLSDPN